MLCTRFLKATPRSGLTGKRRFLKARYVLLEGTLLQQKRVLCDDHATCSAMSR